ncbi:aminopeptidase [Fibrella sp. WM1]|uniref:aminopeptidase n=1 Tax=Fibrella musci TaxID=3242485 RepID=UPI003522A888
MKRILKRIGLIILVALLGLGIWQHELISYGYMQAKGQLHIMLNTRPVAELLADPAIPDSAKAKIRLIGEIKQFAQDSLGLDPSENFTTFHDQEGKPLMWMLVGADRYALTPVQFRIPLLGTFAYRGFFDKTRLLEADSLLRKQGYDTRISGIAAYSTLGFFKDPILSSMLSRNEGDLAQLIIHELTHGTLFIKDNLEYNENLADFVGDYGAKRFMAYKYGDTSAVYRDYQAGLAFWERYTQHVVRGSQVLDKIYRAFKPTTPVAVKEAMKWKTIEQIVTAADTITDERSANRLPQKRVSIRSKLPNNAYFVSYLTYRKQQNRFKTEFVTQFDSDFPRYLRHLKQTYPSL